MRYLQRERETLDRYLPGLDEFLKEQGLICLETKPRLAIEAFRAAGGCGLAVPKRFGGHGLDLKALADIQLAIGSRSPSLVIATNMHVCTIRAIPNSEVAAELLHDVALNRKLVASAFADGRTQVSILRPNITARSVAKGWVLTGKKAPCSLSRSMDYITASFIVPDRHDGEGNLSLAVIPADAPGLRVAAFGDGPCFATAENGTISFEDVFVPAQQVSSFPNAEAANRGISLSFVVFELLVSAAYLGIASGLVEEVMLRNRGGAEERVWLVSETEAAKCSLRSCAQDLVNVDGLDHAALQEHVARGLFCRQAIQRAIGRVVNLACEMLGGIEYLSRPDIIIRCASARGLAFHPPSARASVPVLDGYMAGRELVFS